MIGLQAWSKQVPAPFLPNLPIIYLVPLSCLSCYAICGDCLHDKHNQDIVYATFAFAGQSTSATTSSDFVCNSAEQMLCVQDHSGFLKMFLSLFRVLATNGKHALMMNVFGNPTLLVPMLTTFK